METLRKIGIFFLTFFSFVCIVGGIGTLYASEATSSNLFATGLLVVGGVFFYKLWPSIKKYLLD